MLLSISPSVPLATAVSFEETRIGGVAARVMSLLMTLFIERRELLASFKAGERRALEDCYRHYVGTVATFVRRGFTFRSGDRTLAFRGYAQPFEQENAIQETFLRAFREQARIAYDGVQPYKNYLLAIARNMIIDELRSTKGKELVAEVEGEQHVEDRDAVSAEDTMLERELRELVTAFVANLEPGDRAYFTARFERGESQTDAGRQGGLSLMQARTTEKRLRERFLKFMRQRGYFDGYQPEVAAARAS